MTGKSVMHIKQNHCSSQLEYLQAFWLIFNISELKKNPDWIFPLLPCPYLVVLFSMIQVTNFLSGSSPTARHPLEEKAEQKGKATQAMATYKKQLWPWVQKAFIHSTHCMKDRGKKHLIISAPDHMPWDSNAKHMCALTQFPFQQQLPPFSFARTCLSFSCSCFQPHAISCLAHHIPSQPSTFPPPCLLHLQTLYFHPPHHFSGYWYHLWMVTMQTQHAQALPLPQNKESANMKYPRPGWMRLGGTWCSGRCPCYSRGWNDIAWPSNPGHTMNICEYLLCWASWRPTITRNFFLDVNF